MHTISNYMSEAVTPTSHIPSQYELAQANMDWVTAHPGDASSDESETPELTAAGIQFLARISPTGTTLTEQLLAAKNAAHELHDTQFLIGSMLIAGFSRSHIERSFSPRDVTKVATSLRRLVRQTLTESTGAAAVVTTTAVQPTSTEPLLTLAEAVILETVVIPEPVIPQPSLAKVIPLRLSADGIASDSETMPTSMDRQDFAAFFGLTNKQVDAEISELIRSSKLAGTERPISRRRGDRDSITDNYYGRGLKVIFDALSARGVVR